MEQPLIKLTNYSSGGPPANTGSITLQLNCPQMTYATCASQCGWKALAQGQVNMNRWRERGWKEVSVYLVIQIHRAYTPCRHCLHSFVVISKNPWLGFIDAVRRCCLPSFIRNQTYSMILMRNAVGPAVVLN